MCFSAMVIEAFEKYMKDEGAHLDIEAFERLYYPEERVKRIDKIRRKRAKTPKGMDDWIRKAVPNLAPAIDEHDAEEVASLEQEIFKQTKRYADAERALKIKATKKAAEDLRISEDKIPQLKARLANLKRKEGKPSDWRFFPGVYAPVIVSENGKLVVKPMRYQCRPAGKPSAYDRMYPGTYNARRDNLEGFWKKTFGHTHGIIVVSTFFENVEGEDGENQRLQFTPRDGSPMIVACLWSHWTDPKGIEPDLLSFAAITDEPEPEVAAAGHDRTIINIKPEHVETWLNPDPGNLSELYAIFDDKQHPYYEHRLERAA